MWTSSAPLRISLAGGGTDLPSYARRFGGMVVGVTTTLRTTVVGMPGEAPGEGVDPGNPFAREALRRHWDGEPLTLASFSDLPAGTGMGGSAAFCVALIAGLTGGLSEVKLAEAAASIEIDALRRPVGKQDHYLSTLGGCHTLTFNRDGTVEVERIRLNPEVTRRLDADLLLFATGVTRNAGDVLAVQENRVKAGDREAENLLHEIKELTANAKHALRSGDTDEIGRLLGRHWEIKKRLSTGVTLPAIDRAYTDAVAAGATGGKLLGAGGGGYLLIHAAHRAQADVRAVMAAHGMAEQAFRLEERGHEIVHGREKVVRRDHTWRQVV